MIDFFKNNIGSEMPYEIQEMVNTISRSGNPLLQELSTEELKEVRAAAYKAFENTGLKNKGLDILNITETTETQVLEEIKDLSTAAMKQKSVFEKLSLNFQAAASKIIQPVSIRTVINTISESQSAGYAPQIQRFLINMDTAPELLFHEMGHALTLNNGNFLEKLNFKSKNYTLALAPIFLATSLLKSSKKKNEDNPTGTLDKITTFIKNNCGKLVAATFIPTLIDEALASIKGQNLANKVITSNKILEGIKLTHLKAYSSYLFAPILYGIISALLVKGKDKLSANSETNKNVQTN